MKSPFALPTEKDGQKWLIRILEDKNMEKINFEEALSTLEAEVRRLEGGNLTLDESIEAYEKAIELVKWCSAELTTAEQKVMLLTEASDGSVSDTPFLDRDET